MNRSDLFSIAKKAGWKKGKRLTPPQREELKRVLAVALVEPLKEAPRVFDGSGGRPMTLTDATTALLEEVDAAGSDHDA